MATIFAVATAIMALGAPSTLYVAPGGSDAAGCRTPATACATFDAAYHAAAPGDVVQVAAGTYGPQNFSEDASKTAPADVIVRPALGAPVVVGCPDGGSNCISTEGADHLTVRGVRTAMVPPLAGLPRQGGVAIDRGSEDVTFQDIDAGHIFIASRDTRVIGGDYGPTVDDVSKLSNDVGPNILIDGARFHHHLEHVKHMECIALYGAQGVVIRNSGFDTCSVFGIFGAAQDGEHYRNVLIENNVFSNSGGAGMSAHLKISSHGGDCSNFLIRNNTFVHDNVISDCGIVAGHATNMRWIGNIFERADGCPGGGHVFDYNVIERGEGCGPHDVVIGAGNAGFVDRAGLDFHLRAGSPAIDRGSPASFPATDFDGGRRPAGAGPDAGADEFGAGPGSGGPGTGGGPGPGGSGGTGQRLLTVKAPRRVRVRRLVRRGRLSLKATCGRPCALTGRLGVRGGPARRLHIRRPARLIATGGRRLQAAGTARVVLKVRRKARRALRRARDRGLVPARGRRVRLRLRITATDAAGRSRTIVRRIALVR